MFLNETSFGAGPRDRTLLLGDFGTRDDLSILTNVRLQHKYRVGKQASITDRVAFPLGLSLEILNILCIPI